MECPPDWGLLTKVAMTLECDEVAREGSVRLTLDGELLQILSGTGLVFRLDEPEKARVAIRGCDSNDLNESVEFKDYHRVRVVIVDGPDNRAVEEKGVSEDCCAGEESDVSEKGMWGGGKYGGTTPLSWSLEQLRSGWSDLSPAEKIRVARYGGRSIRFIIIKGIDKQLHGHVLSNPGITPDEVAVMAGEAALDPRVLERIASGSEWIRHKTVVKNLIRNPKVPLPVVRRLLAGLGKRDLVQLQKSDRLRASVREMVSKKLAKF